MSLKAGVAAIDISPRKPMYLIGYPHVERISTGVNDPLLASTLYMENGGSSLLLVAVDILFLGAKTVHEIRKAIAAQSTVKPENIMVTSTHTHSGPLTLDMIAFKSDPTVPAVDPEYMVFIKASIVKAGLSAIRNARSAEIAVSSAKISGVGCNRHDPKGPRDPEAGIIVVRDCVDRKIFSVSIIYCMHPTVLHEDSTLVSSDFPGYARKYLKLKYGDELVVMHHTGPEGNQSPRYHVKGQTFSEAERLGSILGKTVDDEIRRLSDKSFSGNPVLGALSGKIVPSKRKIPSVTDALKNLEFRKSEYERLKSENAGHGPVRTAECSVFGAEERLFIAKFAEEGKLDVVLADYAELEVQVFRIGNIFFVGFPGELFVEYSLELKRKSPERVFAICLANGEAQGYIVTEDATGYEADNSIFLPKTGSDMLELAIEMIKEVAQSAAADVHIQ